MYQELISHFNGMSPEEFHLLEQIMSKMDEKQARTFVMFYGGKRKSPQDILLFTLIGFIGAAGIQRFVVGQTGMGILYFFTGGLCLIGTIIDLINHKALAFDYNKDSAYEAAQQVKSDWRN